MNQPKSARAFYESIRTRRSVRRFSDQPVDRQAIADCIAAAGCAPSGANQQPWHFVAIGDDETKRRIRTGAEAVEAEFYGRLAPQQWKDALAPLGTDASKPFLTEAAWLIAVFCQARGLDANGQAVKHYYPGESVGLATGLLLAAIHMAGLSSLVYTPAPMAFMGELLDRPDNERPFCLVAVGQAHPDYTPPAIQRKELAQIATFIEQANV